mgnify:CR=1 FL=1
MTTDVKVLIAEFLRTHKRLVVPQLGAFIVKAPGGEILFSELFKRDDGVLRGLLTAAGASEIEAAGAIDRLIFDLRHAVQHGGVYLVAGLGTFSAGANGTLAFAYDPQAGAAAGPASGEPAADRTVASGAGGSSGSDAVGRGRTPRYEPDPCVKGLTYGRPVKTTDAYTFVGSKPARRIDAFLIVAIVAALLAVGVIVYGYVNDRRAKQMQAELMEEVSQSAAADEAAAESVAE